MPHPNVILITADSLRADSCGWQNPEKSGLTPNLNNLAEDGLIFSNAFTTGGATPVSFPGILTSTYPLDFGKNPANHEKNFISAPRVLISEFLKKHGFATAAFSTNGHLSGYFGYDRGWDFFEYAVPPQFILLEGIMRDEVWSPAKRFFWEAGRGLIKSFKNISFSLWPAAFLFVKYANYRLSYLRGHPRVEWVDAPQLNRLIFDFLDAQEGDPRPFFLWIHYLDTHRPHFPVDYPQKKLEFREFVAGDPASHFAGCVRKKTIARYVRKDLEEFRSAYDAKVKFLDGNLGELLGKLKEKKLYDNSAIFFTSDHGDEFLEHGDFGHGDRLYDELLRVPLLLKIPGGKRCVIGRDVSLIDICPTIADLLKLPQPDIWQGASLLDETTRPIFAESSSAAGGGKTANLACRFGGWKYVRSGGAEELYDLKNDPGERKNLIASEPEAAGKMRKLARDFDNGKFRAKMPE